MKCGAQCKVSNCSHAEFVSIIENGSCAAARSAAIDCCSARACVETSVVGPRREAACEAERWEEQFNTMAEASKQLCAESLDARGDGTVFCL